MTDSVPKHRAPETDPVFTGDLVDAYDILRAQYVKELARQRALLTDATFALDAAVRHHAVDSVAVPAWRVVKSKRDVQRIQAVVDYLVEMVGAYPERNRNMAVA